MAQGILVRCPVCGGLGAEHDAIDGCPEADEEREMPEPEEVLEDLSGDALRVRPVNMRRRPAREG